MSVSSKKRALHEDASVDEEPVVKKLSAATIVFGFVAINPAFIDVLSMQPAAGGKRFDVYASLTLESASGAQKYLVFTGLSHAQASNVLRHYAQWCRGEMQVDDLENRLADETDTVVSSTPRPWLTDWQTDTKQTAVRVIKQ